MKCSNCKWTWPQEGVICSQHSLYRSLRTIHDGGEKIKLISSIFLDSYTGALERPTTSEKAGKMQLHSLFPRRPFVVEVDHQHHCDDHSDHNNYDLVVII